MKTYPDPARNKGAYKWFIEELRELADSSVHANRIRKSGHPERTNDADLPLEPDKARMKEFFLRQKPEDREMLARLLEEERIGAIHDVASFLEGYLSCDEMKLTFGDQDIPASPYATMHYDLICILEGDEWPDE